MATDPYAGLDGADRDAALFLTNLFTSYGLGSLAGDILNFVKQGYGADVIALKLQDTDAYKQRFKANAARLAAGLPVLSPAEYLATEKAYRDIMSNAGLPLGFYDQASDFEAFLSKDISPTEVQGRVQAAAEVINRADPNTLNAFKQFGYTEGDLISYALDGQRALPLIEKQFKAAQIAGAAANQALGINRDTAERLAASGVTGQQAQQGFGAIANEIGSVNKLNSIYGDDVTQDDLVREVFEDDAEAGQKRKKLASKERAAFGGSGGQSRSSLSKSDAGSL